jgi:hypothetical protein
MAATDVDVCNLALVRVGERQLLTSLTDGSSSALVCSQSYPQARDALLSKSQWKFPPAQSTLIEYPGATVFPAWAAGTVYTTAQVVTYNGNPYYSRSIGNVGNVPQPQGTQDLFWQPGWGEAFLPGWDYTYYLPADFLSPSYIFGGARPGQPVAPFQDYLNGYGVAAPPQMPAINGAVQGIPFQVQGAYLYCDLPNAQLVYTSNQSSSDAPATWPALFVESVAWRLAIDLALSLLKDPELAKELKLMAQDALGEALAAETNNSTPDPRPDASVIAIRGA